MAGKAKMAIPHLDGETKEDIRALSASKKTPGDSLLVKPFLGKNSRRPGKTGKIQELLGEFFSSSVFS